MDSPDEKVMLYLIFVLFDYRLPWRKFFTKNQTNFYQWQ